MYIRLFQININMSFEIFAINAREALAEISSLKLPSFRKKSRKNVSDF